VTDINKADLPQASFLQKKVSETLSRKLS